MQPAEQKVIRSAAALYEQLHSSEPREAWLKAALFTRNAYQAQAPSKEPPDQAADEQANDRSGDQ
jgi:hypothetical protein